MIAEKREWLAGSISLGGLQFRGHCIIDYGVCI